MQDTNSTIPINDNVGMTGQTEIPPNADPTSQGPGGSSSFQNQDQQVFAANQQVGSPIQTDQQDNVGQGFGAEQAAFVNPQMQNVGNIAQPTQEAQVLASDPQPKKKRGLLGFIKLPGQKVNTAPAEANNLSAQKPFIKKGPPKILKFFGIIFLIIVALGAYVLFRGKPDKIKEPTDTEGEVVWWGLDDPAIYAPLIEEFESENANTKVTYVRQPTEDYRQRLENSLSSGQGPDIFMFHNSWSPMFKGRLDRMPGFVMSPEEFSETFYPVAVADLTLNDGIVGIPLEYDALTLFINEDIFAAAGRVPPKKWSDLRILAKELTQRDGRGLIIQSGIPMGITSNVDHWQEIIGFMLFQNHTTPSKLNSSLSREALSYYNQYRGDAVWSNILPPSTIAFANGDVAMYFGTIERASEIATQNPSLRFSTVEMPQLRRDNPEEPAVSYASYWVQGVWNGGESRGVSWNFLKFMSSRGSLEKIYSNAQTIKSVGDPYPRVDMAPLLEGDPIIGSVISLAPVARSWYLADKTYDGETGINSKFSAIFSDLLKGGIPEDLDPINKKTAAVLAEYGLSVR